MDGIVGQQTWRALMVTIRQGDDGDAVRAAQRQLARRGMEVEVDGDFGPQTEQAVRAFQQANRLAVDGVVGQQTWGALIAVQQRADLLAQLQLMTKLVLFAYVILILILLTLP